MTLERVEVAQAGWTKDRRSEQQVGLVEQRIIVGFPGREALDQLGQGGDPQARGKVSIEGADRLAIQHRVVGQPRITGHGAAVGRPRDRSSGRDRATVRRTGPPAGRWPATSRQAVPAGALRSRTWAMITAKV